MAIATIDRHWTACGVALAIAFICSCDGSSRDASIADGAVPQRDAASEDAGDGVACGNTTCAPGQVCCPGCEPGTGSCSVGGCPGFACPQDAGGGTPCGDNVCPAGQSCCDHCTGACVSSLSGAFCPDDNDPNHACGDAGPCAQQGESCLTTGCCVGYQCCSGIPIPEGQAVCYGGGAGGCPVSDYHMKDGFAPVDSEVVLNGVLALPLSKWRYKDEDQSVAHIGPMAQDFQATFGLGRDDKHIFQLDADGVTFAAIQAMARKLDAVTTAQQALATENAELRDEVQRLRREVTATHE